MKNVKKIMGIFIFALVFAFVAACSGVDDGGSGGNGNGNGGNGGNGSSGGSNIPTIYVAGAYWIDNNGIACYWKDGVRTDLSIPVEIADYFSSSIANRTGL